MQGIARARAHRSARGNRTEFQRGGRGSWRVAACSASAHQPFSGSQILFVAAVIIEKRIESAACARSHFDALIEDRGEDGIVPAEQTGRSCRTAPRFHVRQPIQADPARACCPRPLSACRSASPVASSRAGISRAADSSARASTEPRSGQFAGIAAGSALSPMPTTTPCHHDIVRPMQTQHRRRMFAPLASADSGTMQRYAGTREPARTRT